MIIEMQTEHSSVVASAIVKVSQIKMQRKAMQRKAMQQTEALIRMTDTAVKRCSKADCNIIFCC
jgi:hypothetical protein